MKLTGWKTRPGRVLLKPLPAPSAAGSIVIPERARERPNVCTVVAWAADAAGEVPPGALVYLARYAGVMVMFDDEEGKPEQYIVAAMEDVLLWREGDADGV